MSCCYVHHFQDQEYNYVTILLLTIVILMLNLQKLLIQHTLDVMHIEKNVCESLIKFVFKTKDTIKVCRDMEVCGVWPHLWLKQDPHNSSKNFKPIAPYVLMPKELKTFMSRLGSLKVPSDYCGALGKHIMYRKLGLMKSHDWHVLM
jgi:hypothetical protein